MKTKILLVNFTEEETKKLKKFGLEIHKGFLSSTTGFSAAGKGLVKLYFPHPIYEYKIVVVNLNKNKKIDEEFRTKMRLMTEEDRNEFLKFWQEKGLLIVLLGNYDYFNLAHLGIPDIDLEEVKSQDITAQFVLKEDSSFKKCLKEIQVNIVMPTNKYIFVKKPYIVSGDLSFVLKNIYMNPGDKVLGCYCNRLTDEDRPAFIILPQFRNNTMAVEKILKEIAKIYSRFLPEIYQADWISIEKYYPAKIKSYDERIKKITAKIEEEISELKKRKEKAKQKFYFLRGILHNSGDELKVNVIQVLQEIFKLKVTDTDKEKKGDLAEDILIYHSGKKILAEIKGASAQNPSPTFITQVWKHIQHSKDKDIAEGCLILNHDNKTDPEERNLAYKGEYEKELEDIIFIDTRVLFDLAIAIIDYGLPIREAKSILLQKGRVTFDLQKFIKSKSS